MKSKFGLMWRMAIATVLALSLGLVMAAPVSAAVSQPEVTLNKYTPAAADAEYTIDFTTNEELVSGDTITIEFPETGGTNITAIVDNADVTVGGDNQASVIVGQRLSITLGNDVPIGDVTVVVGAANNVTNPADGDYTLDVYTRQEPTAVTSAEYTISKELAEPTVANPTPQTVGTAATYDIGFITTVELRSTDLIVIEFPVDTDISNVDADDVTVTDNLAGDVAVTSANPVGQVLTITLGGTLITGDATEVTIDNIINPTTVLNPDPESSDLWKLTVYTSFATGTGGDRIPAESAAYALIAKTAISQIAWKTVDEYVPNDTAAEDAGSIAFVIETQDQYGNPAAVTEATTFTLTASSGAFYVEAACTTPTTTVDISSGSASAGSDLYYKGDYNAATAGTVTITADELVTQGWTIASTTILVNPELELWGGGERKAYYNTFALAIAAALPDDTIKVGPSTYEEDFSVSGPYLTIESTAGKATTFITGAFTLSANADDFTLGGTSGKGFTLQTGTPDWLVQIPNAADDVTISYNTFVQGRANTHGIIVNSVLVTGLTVTHNTFTLPYKWGSGIFVSSDLNAGVVGLSVTNNTFTGAGSSVDQSGIELHEVNISTVATTISNNDFTDMQNGILIGTDQAGTGLISSGSPATLEISGNTFTDLMYAIDLVEGADESHDHDVVITENTFTGNTIGIGLNAGAAPGDDDWNPEDMTVNNNDFSGNTYAVFNDADDNTALPLDDNWWGDVTGPTEAGNPGGTGDAIGTGAAGTVSYTTWLNAAGGTPLKSQDITLYAGWNLISLPFIPTDSSIETVLAGVSTGVTVNKVAYYPGGPAADWLNYSPSAPSDLDTMNDGKGYWIDASAGTLTATGVELAQHGQAPPTYDVVAGWNLIGVTSIGTPKVENYLGSVMDTVEAMYLYDASTGAYTAVVITEDLVTGAGYWLAVNAAGTIYP